MKRNKFKAPHAPNQEEQHFIRLIEKYQRIKKTSLAEYLYFKDTDSTQRKIRALMEDYNNGKYINIIPLGKIITVDDTYQLIRSDNQLANKVRLKAKFDLLCAAIDYRNTLKALGTEQAQGQLDIYNLLNKDLAQLIQDAQDIENDLN